MDANRLSISCCQRCRHFTLEGRRGGHCGQLNATVQGGWSACSLAAPVFFESISVVTQCTVPVWSEPLTLAHDELEALGGESAYLAESA